MKLFLAIAAILALVNARSNNNALGDHQKENRDQQMRRALSTVLSETPITACAIGGAACAPVTPVGGTIINGDNPAIVTHATAVPKPRSDKSCHGQRRVRRL